MSVAPVTSSPPLALDFGAAAFFAVDFFAVDFFAVDFLTDPAAASDGSSTTGSRRMPFESARRRTRSAIGSSMLEE